MQEVYLYQTVHILGGRSLHLPAHLAVLDRWSRELFGRPAGLRQQPLARQIEALAAQTAPADCDLSQFVRIVVPASGDPAFRLESAGISLYRGYDLRSLMPDAVTLQYDMPFPEAPTSAREAAAGLARQQARLHGASVAVRCDGDGIVRTADNAPLFAFSLEEFPSCGFTLSEVTHNLHENGPQGIMTDYEAKFHELGTPIHRCVATMVDWDAPENADKTKTAMEPTAEDA